MALMMIAYALGVLVGEAIRDHKYPIPEDSEQANVTKTQGKRRRLYSGLFILLKHNIDLAADTLNELIHQVLILFVTLTWGHVRTNV